eukprot:5181451-Pyramimonas_sp.AAC.1
MITRISAARGPPALGLAAQVQLRTSDVALEMVTEVAGLEGEQRAPQLRVGLVLFLCEEERAQ